MNFSSDHGKETLHKMVVENGGSFSMNLGRGVTHVIAADKKGGFVMLYNLMFLMKSMAVNFKCAVNLQD